MVRGSRGRRTDRNIVAVLYRRYRPRINGWLTRKRMEPWQVEDFIQELSLRISRGSDFCNASKPQAYLYRSTENLINEVGAADGRTKKIMTFDSAFAEIAAEHHESPLGSVAAAELEHDLVKLIAQLTERQQIVVHLSRSGFSYAEIAAQIGVSISVVGQDLMHARQRLEVMLWPNKEDRNDG